MVFFFLFKATPEASRAFDVPMSGERSRREYSPPAREDSRRPTVMFGDLSPTLFLDVSSSGANHRSPFRGALLPFKKRGEISPLF